MRGRREREREKTNSSRLTVLKERRRRRRAAAASSHEVIEEYNNNLLPCAEDNACRDRRPQYAWNSPRPRRPCSTRCAASCTPPCPGPRRCIYMRAHRDAQKRYYSPRGAIKPAAAWFFFLSHITSPAREPLFCSLAFASFGPPWTLDIWFIRETFFCCQLSAPGKWGRGGRDGFNGRLWIARAG